MNLRCAIKPLAALLLAGLFFHSSSHAHPHNWISLESVFILDTENRLVEIEQSWVFDEMYSMITVSEMITGVDNFDDGLSKLGRLMKNNLKSHQYFSHLKIDGETQALPDPVKSRASWLGEMPTGQLKLTLTFRFENSVSILDQHLAWSVYDPTYYIAMNHNDIEDVSIIGGNKVECGKELFIPTPSAELIEYASNLDRTRRDTDGLGIQFAERVHITCI